MHRGVPALRVGEHLVATVLDLILASYGVAREAVPGDPWFARTHGECRLPLA